MKAPAGLEYQVTTQYPVYVRDESGADVPLDQLVATRMLEPMFLSSDSGSVNELTSYVLTFHQQLLADALRDVEARFDGQLGRAHSDGDSRGVQKTQTLLARVRAVQRLFQAGLKR